MTSHRKYTLGWTEMIAIPKWRIGRMRARIDTGAKTSALDAVRVKITLDRKIEFRIPLSKDRTRLSKPIKANIARIATVKSSPHHNEKRIFVRTNIKLGPVTRMIEISLVNRSRMRYRMLLGRSALKGKFLVDVNRKNILTRKRTKIKKRTKRR